MRKQLSVVLVALGLAACGGGINDVVAPTRGAADRPAHETAPTTSRADGAAPVAAGRLDAWIKPDASYYAKNVGAQNETVCVAAFGITAGDQGQHSYIPGTQAQTVLRPGEVFRGQIALSGAKCSYDRVQIDMVPSLECRRFDWNHIVTHLVVTSPNVGTCPSPEPSPTPSPEPSPEPSPTPSPEPSPDPQCLLPEEGTVLSWKGAGDPQTECRNFGLYDAVDEGTPDFYLCKAGNDREVDYQEPTGPTCGNGKDVSHVTRCVCAEAEAAR